MRKLWAVLALLGALAMVPGFQAEAGGGDVLEVDLYLADYPADSTTMYFFQLAPMRFWK